LATGCYAYLKATEPSDFAYRKNITVANNVVTNASFELRHPSAFVQIYLSTTSIGGTYPGLDLLVTQATALEFVTDVQWYEAEVPMLTTVQRMNAMDQIRHYPQFFENPKHLSSIARLLGRGAGLLKKHSGKIAGVLSVLFPEFTGAFAAANTALGLM